MQMIRIHEGCKLANPWESDTAPEVRVGPATAVRHGRRLQVQAGDAAAGTSFFAASERNYFESFHQCGLLYRC